MKKLSAAEVTVIGASMMAEPYLARLERIHGELQKGIEIDADVISLDISDVAFLFVYIDSISKYSFNIAEMKLAIPEWKPLEDID